MLTQYPAVDLRVRVPVAADKAVAVGDICGVASNTLVRASDEAFNTNEATTRANFVAKFVGLSADDHRTGHAARNTFPLDTGVIREMTAESGVYRFGDRVGPGYDGGTQKLKDQVLKKVTADNEAIGYVVEDAGSGNVTTIKVYILPRLFKISL